jgi:hypothetical protein
MSSLVRFENKNIFSGFEKRSILLQRRRCGCKFRSRRIESRIVKIYNAMSSLVRFE